MSLRRGFSNLIAALLTLSAIAIAIPTLFLSTYVSRMSSEIRAVSYLEVDERIRYVDINASAIISGRDLLVVVSNRGGRNVELERVLLYATCLSTSSIVNILSERTSIAPGSSFAVNTELRSSTRCDRPKVGGVYIVTSEPRVYSASIYNLTRVAEAHPNPDTDARTVLPPATYLIVPVRLRANPWDLSGSLSRAGFQLAEVDDRSRPTRLVFLNDYSALSAGMRSRVGVWVLSDVREGVGVSASGIRVRNVFLGHDPRNPSKYVLLLTSDLGITLSINDRSVSYCSDTAARLILYGFTSTRPEGVIRIWGDSSRFESSGTWIRVPNQDVAEYTFVNRNSAGSAELRGRADRLEVYCLSRSSGLSSYSTYLLLFNNAGREGFGGILFTTIDAAYGHRSSSNDYASNMAIQDFSERPLVLVYRDPILEISNNNTKAVAILLNYRFHDNEGNDFEGVTEDRPVMIVGLAEENGRVLSYRTFMFRELTRYEDTYPPTAQAQSAVVFVPLPSKDAVGLKKFYVFIVIQDPYGWVSNSMLDDLDLTLYIDSLSVMLFE